LLIEVARLYYLCDLAHGQIAVKMGLSHVKVTRPPLSNWVSS